MPGITDSIGRVLGDRYRLLTALGTGASAHVYLAEDISLHRQVAIKVLHPALAGDSAFLKRFRAEARAAAALNHPNIMQVFDWGEHETEPYLVLELLSGGSLRQIFDTGTLLTPEQAVKVGLEAAAGLDYAHRRGLVHRDIKPANLLLGDERRLRIADFGLARALAEAAWTEPAGAVLGTARYAAPEQVEGRPLDGRADVYALTLVLYEAVTGEVPFSSDTTIATLMGRLNTPLPPHERLGPLNDMLAQAGAPNPAERYTAAELARRLHELGSSLPPPTPLPVAAPLPRRGASSGGAAGPAATGAASAAGAAGAADQATGRLTGPVTGPPTGRVSAQPTGQFSGQDAPTLPVTSDGRDRTELGTPATAALAAAPASGVFDFEEGAPGAPKTKRAKRAKAAGVAGVAGRAPKPPKRAKVSGPRRRRWPWVVAIIVIVLALLGAGAVVAVRDKVFTPSHTIPSLAGKTVAQARAAVAKDHFTVHESAHHFSITVPVGKIISQQPASAPAHGPPVTAKEGLVIKVVVSSGPPPVNFPNLTTFSSCGDAIKALQALHLVGVCPAANQQYSDTAPAGAILGSTPSGTAPYGSTVVISTSKGHQPVAIPSVAGDSYSDAAAALQAAGFVATQSQAYNATVPAGSVISTTPDPSAGPQSFGSTVTVNVSLGPQPVPVPTGLTGQTVPKATAALQAAGLAVGSVFGPAGGKVFDIDPEAGTQVQPGSKVNLYTK
ncbi:MAG TPA: PASTA domain-containing protein [Acidimicrobiales bacterium]|nr:PASTA domain-containing protein [Acidimicrobiales bacterium]